MLVEFRVENHCSIRTEQVLSMEAGRGGDESDPRPRKVEGHDTPLLPVVALYGANASGKSNVLSAFDFMCDAVVNSHRFWEPDAGVPRSPFAWSSGKDLATLVEVTILIDRIRYEYGFAADGHSIQEEWLYWWPKGKKSTIFERENDTAEIGSQTDLESEASKIAIQVMRPNSLLLSVGRQNNLSILKPVYSWFSNARLVNSKNVLGGPNLGFRKLFRGGAWEHPNSDLELDDVARLLKRADLGICNVKTEVERHEDEDTGAVSADIRYLFQHSEGDDDSWLDFRVESKGTQTLFRLAIPLLRVLNQGSMILIDELESSLHPLIGNYIVNLFNNPETNPKNAQLIFTTHDTNLLAPTLGESPLRRDQIWFTEKDAKGETKLYPLTDFKPRKEENLERGYLQGRYGAIPFLGDLNKLAEPQDVASKS